MCNLYRLSKGPAEIAKLFRAQADPPGNAGESVYPGYPGLVVAEGRVRQMAWGFPLALKGKSGQLLKPKPVNNARTDKLDSFMWRYSFQDRRCLIPVTEFCEAEGEKGAKTRTWFSLPNEEVFAVAGIWRDTDEWGPAYSMIMTEACAHVQSVHDRMPVILAPETWSDWLDGQPDDARLLCQPYPAEMVIRRTSDPWVIR
ncbi:SOS response-associated peptidase [Sphingomonas sp. G124]|uniref:Abasic site processing protein n=1 Tax=Sphingomonas cremea TaxID=2904799 RepID=A0A9X1QJU8_9SPHN|nr:SOS response-associated peptidase family protein [Sphingomonas cremea]MCF2514430.1 SOS response-associated peptidase [Sphingomonas cremea]